MIIDPYRYISSAFGGLSWDFNGVDEYINVPNDSSLSFGNGSTDSAFSISFWAYVRDATACKFVAKYTTATDAEYEISTISGDLLEFRLYDNVTTTYIRSRYNTNLTENAWVHIVGTYNGNGSATDIEIYLDGVNVSNTQNGLGSYTAMHALNIPLTIGKGRATYSDAILSDVYVYDIELTGANVTSIYNSGTPRDERDYFGANIVSCWFGSSTSDGSGGVTDESGNNTNDGTLTNMTVAANVVSSYPP